MFPLATRFLRPDCWSHSIGLCSNMSWTLFSPDKFMATHKTFKENVHVHMFMGCCALFTWLNPLRILERMPVQASVHATKWLQAKSVEMILGERVTDWSHSTTAGCSVCLRTDQGRVVEGDLLYRAIGFSRCSELMYSAAEAKGSNPPPIQVEPTLQVTLNFQLFHHRQTPVSCLK